MGLGSAFVRGWDGVGFFIGWRSEIHLLGGGYLMLRELAMLVDRTGNEPLALWLVSCSTPRPPVLMPRPCTGYRVTGPA